MSNPLREALEQRIARLHNNEYGAWWNAYTRQYPDRKLNAAELLEVAFKAGIRAALSAQVPEDDVGLDEVRETLRLTMLAQKTTGRRKTYTDGFAQGLAFAIGRIDAADRIEALSATARETPRD